MRILLVLLLSVSLSIPANAQYPPQGAGGQTTASGGGPRKQLATIIFAGLAGAILGLSTLSFYGRPQDRLSNIAVGFAVGIISGTIYTTYQAAVRPYEFYNSQYDLYDRPSWEADFSVSQLSIPDRGASPQLGYQWSF